MTPLNILISRFSNSVTVPAIERAFAGRTFGCFASLCRGPGFLPEVSARERVCIDTCTAKWGIYDADWHRLRPLDREIVERMRDCECQVIGGMTRLEEKKEYSCEERKRLYLRHLRFWNHFLEERDIRFFLICGIPHEPPDDVVYALCRARGIPALIMNKCFLKDTLFFMEDWERHAPALPGVFRKLREAEGDPTSLGFAELRGAGGDWRGGDVLLAEKFGRYYESQVSQGDAPVPWYIAVPPKKRMRLRRGTAEQRRRKRRASAMFRFYDRRAAPPDFSRRFLYVPLHVQPEATTYPAGGAYGDQLLIVHMLSALLPPDVLLYVKEHPNQERYFPEGRGRDISFYEDLLAVRRVRFMPRAFSSPRLIEGCIAVATVTGAAGFECLFRGKPALLFGHDFHQFAPGVFPVRTVRDCECALHAILDGGVGPTLPDLRLFLKAVEQTSVSGYFTPREGHSAYSCEENIARCARAIAEAAAGRF